MWSAEDSACLTMIVAILRDEDQSSFNCQNTRQSTARTEKAIILLFEALLQASGLLNSALCLKSPGIVADVLEDPASPHQPSCLGFIEQSFLTSLLTCPLTYLLTYCKLVRLRNADANGTHGSHIISRQMSVTTRASKGVHEDAVQSFKRCTCSLARVLLLLCWRNCL